MLVSRRALLQQQQQQHSHTPTTIKASRPSVNPKAADDEKPWPRSVVLAFYAACGLVVPYSAAWFLSSHDELRQWLLPLEHDDKCNNNNPKLLHALLERMRQHFGEIDWERISEPELVYNNNNNNNIPYKFFDEPTQAVRTQQAALEAQSTVQVRLHDCHNNNNNNETTQQQQQIVELAASTLARQDEVREALRKQNVTIDWPVGLDFPTTTTTTTTAEPETVSAAEQEDATKAAPSDNDHPNDNRLLSELAIYSLWHHHHHHPQQQQQQSSNNSYNMSRTALELSRLDHELNILKQELQGSSSSGRPIDDIQHDLQQKRAERRRLLVKKWLGR